MQPLFSGRNPTAGTDERFDSMLKQAFERSEREEPALPPVRLPEERIISAPADAELQESAPISPLIKVYWLVCGLLLLIILALVLKRQPTATTGAPVAPLTVQPTTIPAPTTDPTCAGQPVLCR